MKQRGNLFLLKRGSGSRHGQKPRWPFRRMNQLTEGGNLEVGEKRDARNQGRHLRQLGSKPEGGRHEFPRAGG